MLTVLPQIAKVLERLPQITKVLERFQLNLNKDDLRITNNQHAFTQGRSTVTALACVTQEWYNATDLGSKFDGVHTALEDFRKAFDLVDHATLLTKLAATEVSPLIWKWTESFLLERTFQVKVPGVLSKSGQVIAGVPQGGVISPTLFNVHINDIEEGNPRELFISTCRYADDCTQYQLVPLNSKSRMKDVVNHLDSWDAVNKIEINAKKTKDTRISFKKTSDTPPPLHVNNHGGA